MCKKQKKHEYADRLKYMHIFIVIMALMLAF